MNISKNIYEKVEVEVFPLTDLDVISTSKPFDGEDDEIIDWI